MEFINFLKEKNYKDIINPYNEVGYKLEYEEFFEQFLEPRVINNVWFFSTEEKLNFKCELKDLVTLTNLIFFFLNTTSYKNPMFKEDADEKEIFLELLQLKTSLYSIDFFSEDKNDYLRVRYTLIYKITPYFEDDYYRILMLKTNKN